ncbi:hypothetical protein CCZ01_04110 [Helicobacter monodelphidis]|uniref:DUF448 domain-containing protein n=1 Tax=Helicobacter sp. 15-1451 TaxID=2004995 RepID=UPI000DCDBFB7|nr:DUF448 domain-containing protein [Helicobacter sp. 15-1451]RAX58004.1 hypothetical protein CCZ01_04110 [Helicobacter sp. 15-1451]
MPIPIRMCIQCKSRVAQNSLIRLQSQDYSRIVFYRGYGRSFYLCKDCINHPKTAHSICKVCKIDKRLKDVIDENLKEIICHHKR